MYKNASKLDLTSKAIYKDPLFRVGLLVKIIFVILLVPKIQSEWFTPFMTMTISDISLDPWSSFYNSGGETKSYPYGIIMYLFHLPFVLLGMTIDHLVQVSNFSFSQLGFSLSLLTADILLCVTLSLICHKNTRRVILFYWLSPIVIYITYWHGQTDIIPILMITSSLYLLQINKFALSASFLGYSVAAKISSIIVAPFILLYLLKNKKYKQEVFKFILIFIAIIALFQGSFLLSEGVRIMIFASPEINKIYDLVLTFSNGSQIYIVPIVYLSLIYWGWRMGTMNYELLYALIGSSFFVILLLTPASVGWFLWVVPFIVIFQINSSSRQVKILITLYSLIFVTYNLYQSPGPLAPLLNKDLSSVSSFFPQNQLFLLLSILSASGLIIAFSMIRHAIKNNDFLHLSKHPIAIGIAGDSSSGKDTLSKAILGIFGENRTSEISGDDYHLFERHDLNWDAKTHLNPMANNLHLFIENSLKLIKGRNILYKHYDHSRGLFSENSTIRTRDVIIISGLHALFSSALRKHLNLKIFLNMDEDLRYFLKIKRDISKRGHTIKKIKESLKRREKDKEEYISNQIHHADIIFSLKPINKLPELYDKELDPENLPPLQLSVICSSSINYHKLHEMLVSLCCAKVDISYKKGQEKIEMLIQADDIKSTDIELISNKMIPKINEILSLKPKWSDGLLGIMQVFTLIQLTNNAKESKT